MDLQLLWLVPLLPLGACVINGLIGQRAGKVFTSVLAVGSVWISFIIAVVFVLQHSFVGLRSGIYPDVVAPFYWFQSGVFQLKMGLLVDPLSTTMILIVSGVGALIHTYSIGYMAEDSGYNRYFCYLNLFTFSMLLLVMADSFLLLFVGWELVGLCSYLLIGFWYDRQSATDAGKKAMIVNRVGDWAFIIGVILTFIVFMPRVGGAQGLGFQQVFGYLAVNARDAGSLTGSLAILPVIAFLLFIGATGKSAQLPILHIWLPDAMEGPTPVSALIHAATMVTAGVYMVARCHDFFLLSPIAMEAVAWVGVITALVAATAAIVQTDIKRVLAYSTISQIGFMFVGAGVGAFTYSIFHLMTHAFFKALLFLGAGAVIHALHDEQDMRKMGGLARQIPAVAVMMGIGVLAISGIVPFAGFWSKDYILGRAAAANPAIWLLGTIASFITAFYMTRLWLMTFHGEEHWRHDEAHAPHRAGGLLPESDDLGGGSTEKSGHGTGREHSGVHAVSGWMIWPMWVLAVLSAVGGAVLIGNLLPDYLSPVFADLAPAGEPHAFLPEMALMVIATVVAIAGIGAGWFMYGRRNTEPKQWMVKHPSLHCFLLNAWGIDAFAHWLFGRVGEKMARSAYAEVEVNAIDRGIVGGLARLVHWTSRQLRPVQSGVVADYALAMAFGVACVVLYFLLR